MFGNLAVHDKKIEFLPGALAPDGKTLIKCEQKDMPELHERPFKMTSREKIQNALNHQEGQIPVDFNGTGVTGIHVSIVEKLREHFGLHREPVKVCEPYQMLGDIDKDLLKAMHIDTVGLPSPNTMFGFRLENWKEWKTPWGQVVLVPERFNVQSDDNGYYIFPQGDTSAPPSGHMPLTGYFFDTIIRQGPIDEDHLNPQDNLEEFGPYPDDVFEYYKTQANHAVKTGRGVVATLPGTAFGDIALVPAPFLKYPKGIRDISEWYISIAARQRYIHMLFDKQLESILNNLSRLSREVIDSIDVVFVCGTDFGTQNGTFCSVETFNTLWKPYYKQLNDWIHKNTPWKTFKHSCGSVVDFIDPFIECGFDILNPVQCSAAHMDPVTLKTRFGDRIVFWGGGVDTQHTLPFDHPDNVRKQVLERCEIFSKNGGYVFNTIHNIQAKTPIHNVIAMLDALNEFNTR